MNDSNGRISAAGGVLFKGDEVLVITEISTDKSYGKFAGKRSVPMGRIEPGEKPEQAAEREFLEETGVSARTVHSLGCYPVGIGDAWMFLMEVKEGEEIISPQEPLNPQWVSIESLLRAGDVRPPTKEAVRRAIELREVA